MSDSSGSCIELLPDELWLQVFGYTELCDLYNAWRNLNSHINAIIQSARISIYIKNRQHDEIPYQEMLGYFSRQIVHIKDERLHTSTSSQAWPIDLRSLENFRSLYLAQCSPQRFDELLNFHRLTRLSLPCDYLSQDFLQRFVIGKERENRFPHLRSIGRLWCSEQKYSRLSPSSSSFSNNTKIEHVHLVMPSAHSTSTSLQYFPRLTLISVDYLAQENTFFSSSFLLIKLRRHDNDELSNLSSMINAPLQSITEGNRLLLAVAACTRRLEINFNGFCNFNKLAEILHRCPILEQLRIKVKYYPQNLDLSSIRQLSPLFNTVTFADIQEGTGKAMIIVKWPS